MLTPTPIEQLRRPHPDQDRIDAEAAHLLRSTAGKILPDTSIRRTPSAHSRPQAKPVSS